MSALAGSARCVLETLEARNNELHHKTEALDGLLRESAYEGIVLSTRNEGMEEANAALRNKLGAPSATEGEIHRLNESVKGFDAEISILMEERVRLSESVQALEREHQELYLRTRTATTFSCSPPSKKSPVESKEDDSELESEWLEEEMHTKKLRFELEECEAHNASFYAHLRDNVEALHERFDRMQEESSRHRAECCALEHTMTAQQAANQELRFEMTELDALMERQWSSHAWRVPGSHIRSMRMVTCHADDSVPSEELTRQAEELQAELQAFEEQERIRGIAGDAVALWEEREALEYTQRQLRDRCRHLERSEEAANHQAELYLRELRRAEGVAQLQMLANEERAKYAQALAQERKAADCREVELMRTLRAIQRLESERLLPLA